MSSKKIAVIFISLVMLLSLIIIIIEIVPRVEAPAILEVDDSGGKPYTSIQAAVDDAQPGDIVFVWNGTYYEDVVINKTINLTGISRYNTTIDGFGTKSCIKILNTTNVNISGFNITNGSYGLIIENSTHNNITNNFIVSNLGIGIIITDSSSYNNLSQNVISNNIGGGIEIDTSSNNDIIDSIIISNIGGTGNGITIGDLSVMNFIYNVTVSSNLGHGIRIVGSLANNNSVQNSNISNNKRTGIELFSSNNTVIDSKIISNGWGESGWFGIHLGVSNKDNKVINTTLLSNRVYGINFENGAEANIVNSTIINSTDNDLNLKMSSKATLLNTSFNRSKVHLDGASRLIVQWYLHIDVIDYSGNPISNTEVKIEENKNGTYIENLITDVEGYIRWITVSEYIQQGNDRIYYTPHQIIAWNDTLVGYAQPIMNESKTVTIVLYNGTLLDLEQGWNLVSLPRIQSDTNLPTVLQSIEGQYDSVQWYNVTDNNDYWKIHHEGKPFGNDLFELNETMGFWIHIIDPGGTTMVVFGDELTSNRNIPLYPGWNLIGYPSLTSYKRTDALNNIDFGSDVDAIWTYNATTLKWKEITASDNFEVGRGYWIHSKVTKTWIVPL